MHHTVSAIAHHALLPFDYWVVEGDGGYLPGGIRGHQIVGETQLAVIKIINNHMKNRRFKHFLI